MTMSLRSLSAAAFLVVAVSASAATVQGVGHSTCSDYVTISRSDNPRLVSNFENWVLGYLSGANTMLTSLNPRNDVLKLVTPAQVNDRLRAVCTAPRPRPGWLPTCPMAATRNRVNRRCAAPAPSCRPAPTWSSSKVVAGPHPRCSFWWSAAFRSVHILVSLHNRSIHSVYGYKAVVKQGQSGCCKMPSPYKLPERV